MRKMSHKPVGVDVLGDPFWMNINAASYYIVQTHIRVPFALPSGGRLRKRFFIPQRKKDSCLSFLGVFVTILVFSVIDVIFQNNIDIL